MNLTQTKTKRTIELMNVSTNVFMILNEETMEIVKQTVTLDNGFDKHESPMLFETKSEANEFASERLEMWDIVNSKFNHKFIQHRQNTQPEVVKVEAGRTIDTDNQALNVKIRFGKWFMDFAWTINNRTNWVHTDDTPTHLDGVEIDDESCQTLKDANTIMFHFNFDETKIGEEIEERKHTIQ